MHALVHRCVHASVCASRTRPDKLPVYWRAWPHQAMHPLVSSLLCVAQKDLFLSSWPTFLATCLTHLKHKVAGIQNLALDSIYRLVWVYLVRWGGESNKVRTWFRIPFHYVMHTRAQHDTHAIAQHMYIRNHARKTHMRRMTSRQLGCLTWPSP